MSSRAAKQIACLKERTRVHSSFVLARRNTDIASATGKARDCRRLLCTMSLFRGANAFSRSPAARSSRAMWSASHRIDTCCLTCDDLHSCQRGTGRQGSALQGVRAQCQGGGGPQIPAWRQRMRPNHFRCVYSCVYWTVACVRIALTREAFGSSRSNGHARGACGLFFMSTYVWEVQPSSLS